MTRDGRRPLIVLFTAVALPARHRRQQRRQLQLARATTRRRELAISRGDWRRARQLVRQLFVESLLLGLLGGAADWRSWGLTRRLMRSSRRFPRVQELTIDGPIRVMPLALALGSRVLFAWLPAFGVRRLHVTAPSALALRLRSGQAQYGAR